MNWLVGIFKNISPYAVIAGGLWVLYNYWRGRTFEKKLLLDVRTSSKALPDMRILFVEVQLTNAGKGKLGAKRVAPNDYVYKDAFEQLKYSCSLQIRRINITKLVGETYLDWYKCAALESVPDIPTEINLLDDYVVPDKNNEIVFWMEPGDIVQLPAPLVLQAGHYLLKVSFYGTNPDKDFWSRLVYTQLD